MTYQSFKQWLFVDGIPEDATEWEILRIDGKDYLIGDNGHVDIFVQKEPLPSGNYTIIGKGDELTENQWKEIFKDSPLNNICEEDGGGYVIESGFKSFAEAYMKWKNLNPSTTLVLLNNEK